MTDRESQIYKELKKRPDIALEELAKKLSISLAALEMNIEMLKQKGYILENGEVVNDELSVTIIGGSNIDMRGKCAHTPIMADSNIGDIKVSSGGVGRNVAENFARLGGDISFVTAIARDVYGRKIFEQLQELNIDIYDSVILKDASTSTYMYILDENGEMVLAVNDMSIMEKIDAKLIESIKDKLNSSVYVFFDGNVCPEAVDAIFKSVKHAKIVVDPVSVNKVGRIAPYLDKIFCLKLNNYEAEEITGVEVNDSYSAERAAKVMIEKGLRSVYITIGAKGVLYADADRIIYQKVYKSDIADVLNTTGAGDAFSAALLYGLVHSYSPEQIISLGMVVALITIECDDTCCPSLSMKAVKERLTRLENE